jgi:hypothetical protein
MTCSHGYYRGNIVFSLRAGSGASNAYSSLACCLLVCWSTLACAASNRTASNDAFSTHVVQLSAIVCFELLAVIVLTSTHNTMYTILLLMSTYFVHCTLQAYSQVVTHVLESSGKLQAVSEGSDPSKKAIQAMSNSDIGVQDVGGRRAFNLAFFVSSKRGTAA